MSQEAHTLLPDPRDAPQITRPMLAAPTKDADLLSLTYPKLISAKIDGVRALCIRGADGKPVLVSRKFIAIPNLHVQQLFAREEFVGLDGELICGKATDKNLMQQTTSAVMSVDGTPDVQWLIFDRFISANPRYGMRAREAKAICQMHEAILPVYWLPHIVVHSYEEMMGTEEGFVAKGFEGAMIRCPYAPYKQGRSTVKQQWLLKIKRFATDEAVVIGTEEQERNDNEATSDNLGYTKRSTHQGGKVAAGILGSLRVRDIKSGVEFSIGTGFTYEQRVNLWEGRNLLIGKLVTYKHFPIGVKDKPRFPSYVAFRDKRDT